MGSLSNFSDRLTSVESNVVILQVNITQFWTLINGIVVFFMCAGFALLEAGAVSAKNVVNTCMRNLVDHNMFGIIFYWLTGFAFAFGSPGHWFAGYNWFALSNAPDTVYALFVFQYAFSSVVPLIVSAAITERVRFECYIIFSAMCSAFIYPICSHWLWSTDGWLYLGIDRDDPAGPIRFQDYAGSVAIHTLGSVMALVAAIIVGPRKCRVKPGGGRKLLPAPLPHNILMSTTGTLILCFCFLCFNGGSQLSMSVEGDGQSASRAVLNSLLMMGGAALSATFFAKVFPKWKWQFTPVNNASLAGLVTACSGCNVFNPWAAFVVGVISGGSYTLVSLLIRVIHIDDPCDTVAIHLGGGFWGGIAPAFLDRNNGIIFNWNRRSGIYLGWQLTGIASTIVWGTFWSGLIFGTMRLTGLLRVSEESELNGVDWMEHGERAYPPSAYVEGWDNDEDDKCNEARNGEVVSGAAGDGAPVVFTNVVSMNSVPNDQSNRNLVDNVSVGCALDSVFTTEGNPPANGFGESKFKSVAANDAFNPPV